MANHLYISYDLMRQGQNYQALYDRIAKLGATMRIHQSFWFAHKIYSANDVALHLAEVMDQNDKIFVVDAAKDQIAAPRGLTPQQWEFLYAQGYVKG